jgi:tetratricopeptide (TPR) repeat protein
VLRLSVLVCRGLEHAYAGGLRGHGNLKPSNLLLGLDGGLRLSEAGLSGTESPVHMAPERFEGALADESSDLYSLGVLLFQMTAGGSPPFDAPAAGGGEDSAARYRAALHELHRDALVPRVDSLLAAVLERCLQKMPRERFASVAALRAELEDLLRRETGLLPDLRDSAEEEGWETAQHGLALLAVGRAEPALRAFDAALPALPPAASVLSVRATAINVLGRHDEALAAAEEALSVDPQYAAAWRQKGESLAALQRSDDALAALEQATLLSPRDAATFVSFASLLGTLGRLPQALAVYDRAVSADPDHVDVWFERGRTLLRSGEGAEAAGAFLRFLDLSSSSHPARRKAEELLTEARAATAGAVGVAALAAPTSPPSPEPPREESAPPVVPEPPPPPAPQPELTAPEPTFVPDGDEEPSDTETWRDQGIRFFREGRLTEALDAFDRALALDRRHPETLANRATVLFRLGRAEEALAGHEQALGQEPRLASSWLNKALIEAALSRPDEARRSLLELVSLDPPPEARLRAQADSQLVSLLTVTEAPRRALGHLLAGAQNAQAGRLEEAVLDLDAALQEEPLLPLAWLYKGDALASLSRPAEAASAYEEGLLTDPGDSRLLLGLARSRARLGHYDQALAALDRCLESDEAEARAAAAKLRQAVTARRDATAAKAPPAKDAPAEAAPPAAPEARETTGYAPPPTRELEFRPEPEPAPAAEPSPEPAPVPPSPTPTPSSAAPESPSSAAPAAGPPGRGGGASGPGSGR